MRYRIIAVVEAPETVTVSHEKIALAIAGSFTPQATEVVMVDVHQWDITNDIMKRLRQLAQWHRECAGYTRAPRERFHEQAWYDIRAALGDEDVTRAVSSSYINP